MPMPMPMFKHWHSNIVSRFSNGLCRRIGTIIRPPYLILFKVLDTCFQEHSQQFCGKNFDFKSFFFARKNNTCFLPKIQLSPVSIIARLYIRNKACGPQVTRQVFNLFQDSVGQEMGFFIEE